MVGRGDAKSSLKSRLTTAVPELADADKAVLDRLRKGEVDVLVGTQMVTKGHDIAGVSLVGVVLAGLVAWGVQRFQAEGPHGDERIVVIESGDWQFYGLVTDLQMQPLRYNTRPSLLSPHFFALSDAGHALWRTLIESGAMRD